MDKDNSVQHLKTPCSNKSIYSKLLLIGIVSAIMGCETGQSTTEGGVRNAVGTPLETNDWIPLAAPTSSMPISQVILKTQSGTPLTLCSLYENDPTIDADTVFPNSSGTRNTELGGFLSILQGALPKNSQTEAAVRAGWKRVTSYDVTWGPLITKQFDFGSSEAGTELDVFGRDNGICRNRVNALKDHPVYGKSMLFVLGTIKADWLTVKFSLNEVEVEDTETNLDNDDSSDGGSGADEGKTQSSLVASSVLTKVDSNEDGSEEEGGDQSHNTAIPRPDCGLSASAEGALIKEFRLGGRANVCQIGQSTLAFTTPYIVGARFLSIDELEPIAGGEVTEKRYRLKGNSLNQKQLDEVPALNSEDELELRKAL